MRWYVLVLAAALLAAVAHSSEPDACPKIKGFTIHLTPVEDGYLMPISIADTPRQFLFEFSSAYSKMDEAIADELKLRTKSLPRGMGVSDAGGAYKTIAIVPTLTLGLIKRQDVELLVGPHRSGWGPVASGTVAMNLFYGLDVELDLGHDRLGLFLPRENCDFTPFWPSVEWGSGEFKVAPTGGVYVPMYLDDKKLVVTFNTTEKRSYMPFESARTLFGIEENDPRLVPAGFLVRGDAAYRFPFKTLSGGHNVKVIAPEIYVVGNRQTCGGVRDQRHWDEPWTGKCFGGGDLELGTNVLKKLHFFFASKDKQVYFTLSEPPGTPSP